MAICSYLVIPGEGRAAPLARQLAALPGCDVARAENREVLVLVTDTASPEEEATLRDRIASLPDVGSLVLTFGEIDPEAADAPRPRHG